MNLSSFVLEASEQEYKDAFDAHPVFAALQNGKFSRTAYLAYLRETFHLIRHTTATFARAVAHVSDAHRGFRGWLLDQAVDEHNHDLLCITDIEALGETPAEFLSAHPRRGAWGLITQCYYLAEHNPVALLGYLLTTEGIGASYAAKYADLLTGPLYGYKSNQVTFLRAHGGFDVKHFEDVKNFMDRLDADASLRDAILAVRRFTIMYYSQMLRDSLDGVAVADHR
jgi:pyrroloquinoline quinone (PQQ) biosynthesis protein C